MMRSRPVVLRPPDFRGQFVLMANWAAMAVLYLVGAGITATAVIPQLGVTPEVIAAQEGITLAVEHWEVVRFVREFYLEFNTSPAIRMLVKAMANKFGEEKGNSRYLYRLFPKGPAKQATKIAGLPKPVKCI